MMSRYMMIVFMIVSSLSFSQIQDSTILIIPSSYSLTMSKPMFIKVGSTVKFEADSIYLVNSSRLRFYEELRNTLTTLNFNCEPTIELYKKSLIQNSLLTQQLLDNSEKTTLENIKLINDSNMLLNKQDETLNLTINNLNSTKEHLELAKAEMSRIKRNNIWENILYSLAGIGVGILVGISIN